MDLPALISGYGVGAVALGAMIEGETVTFLGGVLAHRGLLPLGPTVLAAAAGAMAVNQAVFLTARHAGGRLPALRGRAAGAMARLNRIRISLPSPSSSFPGCASRAAWRSACHTCPTRCSSCSTWPPR